MRIGCLAPCAVVDPDIVSISALDLGFDNRAVVRDRDRIADCAFIVDAGVETGSVEDGVLHIAEPFINLATGWMAEQARCGFTCERERRAGAANQKAQDCNPAHKVTVPTGLS